MPVQEQQFSTVRLHSMLLASLWLVSSCPCKLFFPVYVCTHINRVVNSFRVYRWNCHKLRYIYIWLNSGCSTSTTIQELGRQPEYRVCSLEGIYIYILFFSHHPSHPKILEQSLKACGVWNSYRAGAAHFLPVETLSLSIIWWKEVQTFSAEFTSLFLPSCLQLWIINWSIQVM